jgi:hypothetical protein
VGPVSIPALRLQNTYNFNFFRGMAMLFGVVVGLYGLE